MKKPTHRAKGEGRRGEGGANCLAKVVRGASPNHRQERTCSEANSQPLRARFREPMDVVIVGGYSEMGPSCRCFGMSGISCRELLYRRITPEGSNPV